MPLDPDARRYADNLYNRDLERITREYEKKATEITQDFSRRGILRSGGYVRAISDSYADRIETLAQARLASLLTSYERAGLPFDDIAAQEISTEVQQLCETQGNHALGPVHRLVNQAFGQTFGVTAPEGMLNLATARATGRLGEIVARANRELRIRRDEIVLEERKVRRTYAAGLGKTCDVFICHASEDKEEFVRPLAAALADSGLSVWYDESTLKIGDSLRQEIDAGLARSRYGIVVLSHNFFNKKWPQQELDGLLGKEVVGVKVILPVWHRITEPEVRGFSPILAGRLAANSASGIDMVVKQLREAMGIL